MKTNEIFERLLNSRKFKGATPEEKLQLMFQYRTLDQLLASGHVLDVETARMKLGGMAAWSLRRRCRKDQQPHILFGGQYLFLPSQIDAAFKTPTTTSA